MKKFSLLGATALQSIIVVGVFGFAQSASAQDVVAAPVVVTEVQAQPDETPVDPCVADPRAEGCAVITVTGSRIRRPNLDSGVPITSVSPSELTSRGEVSLGDALNDLPALRATFSQANSTGNIGTAGLSLLDLRGLGTTRTLVLVNGRRHVTAQPGNYNVDVNTIPVDLLERTDVVTGGNSAIYGSDAVAGVVNFILRKDFQGAKFRAQAGTSTYGDRGNQFLSGVVGQNFMDGKLNVTVHGEYSKSNEVFYSDRNYLGAYTGPSGFITSQTTSAPNRNFDGIPNTQFFSNQGGDISGIRNGSISTGGMVLTTCPTATSTNAARVAAACAPGLTPLGATIPRNYAFLPDGTLAADFPDIDNRQIGGGVIGGRGATGLEDAMLLPGLRRLVGNLFVNAELSPAFQPFFEGKFVRINATQQSTQPTFMSSNLSPVFSINNAFLTPEARAQLVTLSAVGATTFTMQRFNNDIGTRAEQHKRDTYRMVGGVRGDISETGNLRYELALNYGHTKTFYETGGNVNLVKFNKAANAVRDASGQTVCFANTPQDVFLAPDPRAGQINTTNDDPSCVPINLFGFGNSSQAALNYVIQQSTREQTASQLNVVGFVSGDSEKIFELPGGPIGFALGGEYRKEKATSVYDLGNQRGETFLNAVQPFLPPAAVVKEAFGEVRLPIVKDVFLLNELTVEGAARYSKYRGKEGVWAYNAGLIYSPFDGLRMRGGVARSVRAPNLSDQFGARSETFANAFTDPCDQPGSTNSGNNITTDPNRAKNCAAAGIPTTITYVDGNGLTVTKPFTNVPGSGISGINSGNADLIPETAKSYTLGAVIQPPFIPGFALTIDYYNIKVKDVIQGLTGQAIINRCYDDPTGIDNQFCSAIFRRTSTDPIANATFNGQTSRRLEGRPQDPLAKAGDGVSFINQPYNFAARVRRGIDFDASYRRSIFGGNMLSLRGIASYLIRSEDFGYLTQPDRSDKLDGTFGDPKWGASFNANLDFGKLDLSYGGTFNGKQTISSYETQFEHQGRGPTNPDARPFRYYPSQVLHNARINFEPTARYRIYAGVDNVTNERPPYDVTGIEGGSTFSPTGRYFYAGAEVRF